MNVDDIYADEQLSLVALTPTFSVQIMNAVSYADVLRRRIHQRDCPSSRPFVTPFLS